MSLAVSRSPPYQLVWQLRKHARVLQPAASDGPGPRSLACQRGPPLEGRPYLHVIVEAMYGLQICCRVSDPARPRLKGSPVVLRNRHDASTLLERLLFATSPAVENIDSTGTEAADAER